MDIAAFFVNIGLVSRISDTLLYNCQPPTPLPGHFWFPLAITLAIVI